MKIDFFERIRSFEQELESSWQAPLQVQQKSQQWLQELKQYRLQGESLADHNPLLQPIQNINQALAEAVQAIQTEWQRFDASQGLSEALKDKLIFFVFGKVNAGKSRFCNLWCQLYGGEVERFYLEDEQIKSSGKSCFQVGQTETTAQIQWAEMGSLILVDSPGLHSMTPKNAELTQKYLNSADALIWLTSSSSPGQVQELNELANQLQKQKPLLPVITKSDLWEEDWDEASQSIVQRLMPKPEADRQAQQADVQQRSQDYLQKQQLSIQLLAPVSISVRLAEEQYWDESNILQFFDRLNTTILPQALQHRLQKSQITIQNYLQKVSQRIEQNIQPHLQALQQQVDDFQSELKQKQQEAEQQIWSLMPMQILSLVDQYKSSQNKSALVQAVSQALQQEMQNYLNDWLEQLFKRSAQVQVQLKAQQIADYESVYIEYIKKGRKKTLWEQFKDWDWGGRKKDKLIKELVGVNGSPSGKLAVRNSKTAKNRFANIIQSTAKRFRTNCTGRAAIASQFRTIATGYPTGDQTCLNPYSAP